MATSSDSLAVIDSQPREQRKRGFAQRHGLFLVGVAPVLANIVGSVFNIWYNHTQVERLLSEAQFARFNDCWQVFNLVIYPIAVSCWVLPLIWLRPIHKALLHNMPVDQDRLMKAQRYVVNLPWWILTVSGVGWLICIPIFPSVIKAVPEPLEPSAVWHLVMSFIIGGQIAITNSFFSVEIVSQKALFPVYFRNENPADVPGAMPLSITSRGVMWGLSAGVSPVLSLALLLISPDVFRVVWFVVAVTAVNIIFILATSLMLGKLIADPVRKLRRAAIRIADGDLNIRVNELRADDFGPLIERFNLMVEGLREREQLQQTFGRHVGREAAKEILKQGDGLVGAEQVITVMFVDVRNFTEHSSSHSPEEVVTALNVFFREAVETVEQHGGMVNKFLGDGFMALFGIGAGGEQHALQAVEAGKALLCCLDEAASELAEAGWPELKIGIGVNTGPAIVGSIGSPKRQEYTAIGDTVNVASRVEALTKKVGRLMLITEETRRHLPAEIPSTPLPPQEVKGKGRPLQVHVVEHVHA